MELGEFLRSRRARLRPQDTGTDPGMRRRRVPGLRREELARMAGVSVDYYTRLEQGRSRNASPAVLEAIARALRLDDTERDHLFNLVAPVHGHSGHGPPRIAAETWQLIESLDAGGMPAFVMARNGDILAANRLFRALVFDVYAVPSRERNLVRFTFFDPRARELSCDWDECAGYLTAMLKFQAGRHPDDSRLNELIRDLMDQSADFRRLWAKYDVHEQIMGVKCYNHPDVGRLSVAFHTMSLPGEPDQKLFIYTATPGTSSSDALRLLAKHVEEGGLSSPDGRL
ncbi:transcriptional regulator [Sphaerisporangium melleum]|uniref:Transcriptional regulator n=1 Tax=Sphaerisporangium melleum TaxID=321316 RepID=A0A917VTN5_9ACTN|nr:transcriptional regulator [Sphaerisporangium melleum]GII74739.1 transcriptional regulator [Sphaerisporangium melleum]